MKKIFALVLLLTVISLTGSVGFTQTLSDEVRVTAGVTRVIDETVFTASGEVRKTLGSRVGLVNTFSFTKDSDVTLLGNISTVRFVPVRHVFVAGGVGFGKLTGSDVFVNPVVQAGGNFSVSRVNFEPYVQLETPDLASDSSVRTLSANLNVKVSVTDKFGFLGTGSLRSSRVDNSFFEGNLQKTATAGVYWRF